MLDYLINLDTQLFRWINSHHCVVADWVLWVSSQAWSWAIVLAALFCFVTLRHEPRKWWVVGIGIALCFLLSDRISVVCFKDVVCRLRPCHVLEDVRMFRTHCGGQYGFVSSHAANVFALAMFFALRYGGRNAVGLFNSVRNTATTRWLVPLSVSLWATVVIYSRPYLGKHYPGDCICGALLGIAIGALVYFMIEKIADYRVRYRKKHHDGEEKA